MQTQTVGRTSASNKRNLKICLTPAIMFPLVYIIEDQFQLRLLHQFRWNRRRRCIVGARRDPIGRVPS
jgi:hypothetical protein